MRSLRSIVQACLLVLAISTGTSALEPFATLRPADDDPLNPNDFGHSVAVSGDWIAVGAPGDDSVDPPAFDNGAVYLFHWNGVRWSQEAKLIGSQASFADCMGYSVAMQGDLLVAGQPHCDPTGADFGAAYVFRRAGESWVEEQILAPSLAQLRDYFGYSVAVDADRIAVGALMEGTLGRVFVFRRTESGWVEEGALAGSDTTAPDQFGAVVAIGAESLLAGVSDDPENGDYSGAVYAFRHGERGWQEEAKLVSAKPYPHAFFGAAVALEGDTAFIAEPGGGIPATHPGQVMLFHRTVSGWEAGTTIQASDGTPRDGFGAEIAVAGDLLAAESPGDEPIGLAQGSLYIFDFTSMSWTQRTKIHRPDPQISFDPVLATGLRWMAVATALPSVYVYCTGLEQPCIPAVSRWGVAILVLLLAIAGSVTLRHRQIATAAMLFFALSPSTNASDPRLEFAHHPEHLLVRFKGEAGQGVRRASHVDAGGSELRSYRCVDGLTLVHVPAARLAAALSAYAVDPSVMYVEPDYTYEATGVPNDTYFANQWGMQNTGQTVQSDPGTAGDDIRAVGAWDSWQGDEDFRIAVLDSGLKTAHADLHANTWTNPSELPGDANGDFCPGVCGVDDDGDGHIDEAPEYSYGYPGEWDDDENGWCDDEHGYNFDPDPNGQQEFYEVADFEGHGTEVTGIIAARGNNGKGVAGVNWRCKIVPLRTDADGSGILESRVLGAIDYIISNSIKVSNNSYGGYAFSQAFYDAIQNAGDQVGHVFVAGAGNDALSTDVYPFYPASYDLPNIVAVLATNNDDQLWPLSNYGVLTVDVSGAAGSTVYTTSIQGTEGYVWALPATSYATPHVSGVLALLWSQHPTWEWMVIKNRVLRTARPVPALSGKCVTGGVVNAFAALNDCNLNGAPDDQEVAAQSVPDCNANGIPDFCDVADGFSEDCQLNGVPDSCEGGHACCLPDDTCHIWTQACCTGAGGQYFGQQTQCRPWTCLTYGPQP